MTRKELLQHLAKMILDVHIEHPLRVGIDGARASGKTSLANELEKELKLFNRQIIQISSDDFRNPKAIRYRKGRNSAEGYYHDSCNDRLLIEKVLQPLGPGGDLSYKKASFNFQTDSEVHSPTEYAKKDAIILVHGVFLLRPELVPYWDFKIFLDSNFQITLERAIKRDGYYLGSEKEIVLQYNERYIPGMKIYFKESHPAEVADLVIDTNDMNSPVITKMHRDV